MFCSNCGNEVNKSQRFCDNCGEIIKKEMHQDNNYQDYGYYTQPSKGVSIAGFIISSVAFILSMILIIWVNTREFYDGRNILPFGLLGLTSAMLLITGFVLSVVGVVRTKDAFGIIGIVLSVSASILDIVTLLIAISPVVFD